MSLKFLQKFIRGMSHALEEKPVIEPDDFELEHFLFYHGLAGTSPQNQRKFKDVKADVRLACNSQSSYQLAATLKLPPLWWEEKLKTIFQELPCDETVSLLSPELLLHENWQVRANAANILACLKAEGQIENLIESLHNTADNTKTAFCHQASALARLGQSASAEQKARVEETLFNYLNHNDSWIKVDATNAVCLFEPENAHKLEPLLKSLAQPHLLQDYCSVIAAKTIKPEDLLAEKSDLSIAAGASIILGLLEAATGTFGPDCTKELDGKKCLDQMLKIAKEPSFHSKSYYATLLLAILRLESYLGSKEASGGTLLEDKNLTELLETRLKLSCDFPAHEKRNAIILCGEAKKGLNALLEGLKPDYVFVDETIDSLAKLADNQAAEPLLSLVNKLVNLEERTNKTVSAQPLLEDHTPAVKTYWRILQCLGSIPTPAVLEFLVRATNDHAPDKRLAALNSMVKVKSALPEAEIAPVSRRLGVLITDQSLEIRTASVKGVGILTIKEEIPRLAQMTSAKEVSLSRQIFQTLSELAASGHKDEVESALRQKLKSVMDPHLSKKLNDLIVSLASH